MTINSSQNTLAKESKGSSAKSDKYILERNQVESERLTTQYHYSKQGLGRSSAVPSCINLNAVNAVMDVAAGTLVWTLDLTCLPNIKSRLPASSPSNPLELYACDISLAQFPGKEIIDDLGVVAFEQDVTKPFPEHLKNKFDLINMRCVAVALNMPGWENALNNLYELLKPGGHLILFEANMTWSHPDGKDHFTFDPSTTFDEFHWSDEINHVVHNSMVKRFGLLENGVERLPKLLVSPSWTVVSHEPILMPVGAACRTFSGPRGAYRPEDEPMSLKLFTSMYETGFHTISKTGALEGAERKYSNDEEVQTLVDKSLKGLREEGGFYVWYEIVARKN